MIPGFIWQLPARVVDWHDGDTCHADVAFPRGPIMPEWSVRVLRLYCPELDDPDTGLPQPGSIDALAYAIGLCPPGTLVRITGKPLGRSGRWSSSSQESLGRLLGSLQLPDLTDFADRMVMGGHGAHSHVPGSGEGIVGIDHPHP